MKALIYQVLGNLEGYSSVTYEIEDGDDAGSFIGRDFKLSSEVLYSYYRERKGYEAKIIYVCPNSLYRGLDIQKYLTDTVSLAESLRNKISNISNYKDFEILPINAIGNYMIGQERFSFKNTPGNVAVQIFLDIMKRINENGEKTIVVTDMSTGYNIYVTSVLEALRAIIVYDKLRNGITEKKINAFYAISEPVTKLSEELRHTIRIFVNEYDVKAFFTLPIKPQNLETLCKIEYYVETNPEEKKRISYETKDKKTKLKYLLDNLVKAFHSIKYNVPLAFYSELINLDQKVEVLEKELICFFLEKTKPVLSEKIVAVNNLKWKDVFNLFYSLALFKWISNEMEGLEIKDGVSITEIKERFTKIYDKLDLSLNKRFLERDLSEIDNKKNKVTQQWTCLNELYQEGTSEEKKEKALSTSDIKRNFFAHSGLERTMVEVRKQNEELELRYIKEKLPEICKWLFNPEG
jgi:CRISPR-associated protein Csx1